MTKDELMIARDKYDHLVNMNEDMICLRERFLDFCNNSIIQEYIALISYNNSCYKNRIMELENMDIVKKYLYLLEKYNGFEIKLDGELISLSFSNLVGGINNTSGVYVYISSYKLDTNNKNIAKVSDYDLPRREFLCYNNLGKKGIEVNKIYNKLDVDEFKYIVCESVENTPKIEYDLIDCDYDGADIFLYRDLETMTYIFVSKKDKRKFESSNKVISFKNGGNDTLKSFYNLRVMYLRQYLFNDDCKIFKKDYGLVMRKEVK